MKKFAIIASILIISSVILSPAGVSAKQTITISPALFNLKLVPGMSTTKLITIKNQGPESILFRVYISPLNAQNNNYLSWFSLPNVNQTLVVPDFSEKNLQVAINIPNYAPPAGYYAQVFFEPLINNHLRNSLQITPVFAVPLLVDVLDLQKNGGAEQGVAVKNIELKEKVQSQILKFAFNKIFRVPTAHASGPVALMEKSPLHFEVTLKNNGRYLAYSKGKISIYDLNRKKITSANLPEISLLPGEGKTVDVLMKIEPQGMFSFAFPKRLKAVIETEAGNNEFIFWAFSWKKSLFASMSAFLFLALFCLRKRIKRAARILLYC